MRTAAAFVAVWAGCVALLTERPAATRPAGRAPASGPSAPAPAVPVRQIDQLVANLASDQYKVRRAARDQLLKIVDMPGVGEVLKDRLNAATDAETIASLEQALDGYDLPLAMVWYAGGSQQMRYPAPAPWLFLRFDGSYFIDRAGMLLTGRAPSSPVGSYRQGKLKRDELYVAKNMITASGLAVRPGGQSVRPKAGAVRVSCYIRSGTTTRIWSAFWPASTFAAKADAAAAGAGDDVKLTRALVELLARGPSQPYEGPVALHVVHGGMLRAKRYSPAEMAKLPEWTVPAVSLTDPQTRTRGIILTDAQLKAVRAALAKTDIYKYHLSYACRVYLAPYLKDAADIQFGAAKR